MALVKSMDEMANKSGTILQERSLGFCLKCADFTDNRPRLREPFCHRRGSSCDSLGRLMRRGRALLELRYRNGSNVWIQPVALTRLVFDEQMFGRLLAEFLPIAFVHRGAATAHSLSNRPLMELEAIGQLV